MVIDKILKSQFKTKGIIVKLIIINIIMYVVINMFASILFLFFGHPNASLNPLLDFFSMPLIFSNFLEKPWTIFTHMFLHEGFFHILFNMLWLFWMGKILSMFILEKQILKIYIYGGLFGGLLLLIASNYLGLNGVALGASAAVTAPASV